MFYIASNLEEDKEYSFEVCAVTQRGRGEVAPLTIRTLRQGSCVLHTPTVRGFDFSVIYQCPLVPNLLNNQSDFSKFPVHRDIVGIN